MKPHQLDGCCLSLVLFSIDEPSRDFVVVSKSKFRRDERNGFVLFFILRVATGGARFAGETLGTTGTNPFKALCDLQFYMFTYLK